MHSETKVDFGYRCPYAIEVRGLNGVCSSPIFQFKRTLALKASKLGGMVPIIGACHTYEERLLGKQKMDLPGKH